jgi:PBP1b-binding outer membrane lipoprotein LpoB
MKKISFAMLLALTVMLAGCATTSRSPEVVATQDKPVTIQNVDTNKKPISKVWVYLAYIVGFAIGAHAY